jgi:capsular exopolysaccharide synthesis family protein
MDYSIRTGDEVQKAGETLLGVISNRPLPASPLLLRSKSRSLHEAYRRLWLGLQSRKSRPASNLLMVTSAGRREGRTTMALNLATCLAREGRSVLLLDTDRQQPSLHRILGVRPTPGLTEVFSGQADIAAAVVATSVRGLSLIPRGSTTVEALQEAGTAALAESLKSLAANYDAMIMDSAAVMEDLDAVMMSASAGMVLFVLGCGKETPEEFTQAMELFRRANVRVSGVVLNRVPGALRVG